MGYYKEHIMVANVLLPQTTGIRLMAKPTTVIVKELADMDNCAPEFFSSICNAFVTDFHNRYKLLFVLRECCFNFHFLCSKFDLVNDSFYKIVQEL